MNNKVMLYGVPGTEYSRKNIVAYLVVAFLLLSGDFENLVGPLLDRTFLVRSYYYVYLDVCYE